MSNKNEVDNKGEEVTPTEPNYCFVIMPISDHPDYEPGHFRRVYDYIIIPACKKAGLEPIRADEVAGTNMIVIDILRKIINSKMAVCDLSSRNPNVLYELGIRQSFDLPVTFMKDDVTDRIFDIQGFRDVHYKKSLRFDEVTKAVDALAKSINETLDNKGKDVNSIIELLGISKAIVKGPITLSEENSVLLDALNDIRERINSLNQNKRQDIPLLIDTAEVEAYINPNWEHPSIVPLNATTAAVEDRVEHAKFGPGVITKIEKKGSEIKATINFLREGEKVLLLSFAKLRVWKTKSDGATFA